MDQPWRPQDKFSQFQLTGNVPCGYDCLYTLADGQTLLIPRALPAAELPGKPASKDLEPVSVLADTCWKC